MNTLEPPLPEAEPSPGWGDGAPAPFPRRPTLSEIPAVANHVATDIAINIRNLSHWRGAASYLRRHGGRNEALNQLLEFGRSRNDVLDQLFEFATMFLNVPSLVQGELSGRQLERTLDDVSVQIPRGSVVCVVDIGGLSRIPLMRIIANMIPPKSGEVILKGRVVSLEQADSIPMPYRTIRHNLVSLGRLLGLQRNEVLSALPSMKAFTGEPEFFHMPVRRVPKSKKFDISLSLVCSGVFDIVVVEEVRKIISESWLRFVDGAPQHGNTLIISSSKIQDALELSTYALLLNEGRLLDFGITSEMTRRHSEFIDAANRAQTCVTQDYAAIDDDQEEDM